MPPVEEAIPQPIPFLSSVPVSAILLVGGIVLFVILCYKGINTAASAIIASAVVALGSGMGFIDTMTNTWIAGVGEFIGQNGFGFISAGLFSFLMRETKSGESMANTMIKWINPDFSPYIIAIVAALLQLAGINTYIFIVATMTFSLMKKVDLPIYIGYAACIAVPPIVTFTLPGVPAMPNVLPTMFLGTTTMAAPLLSLATAAVGIILVIIYMQHLIHKARKNGEHYTTDEADEFGSSAEFGDLELPAFWKAILPIVLIIVLVLVFQNLGLTAMQALIFGMWITCAVIVFLNWDTCIHKIKLGRILSQGCTEMFGFIFVAACVYGFGKVTAASACYDTLMGAFMNIHVNPYLTVWLSVCLIAALCADGVGGMVMWLSTFGPMYGPGNQLGVNPAAVHRIAVSAATTFDSLPHSAMLAQGMAVFRTNMKESYKYSFVLTVLFPVIFSLVAVVGAIIFY
ncbi:MAG: GntP family permease [Oscillospiraceae bacterium]|nr:GntP family permease [Oscillospiraceae bacterium]